MLRIPCITLFLVAAACIGRGWAQEIDFNRDIRPILSDHCFQCHGPDENQRQADLRFDLKEFIFGDLGGYAAFVPNQPDESEAIRRIFSEDPSEVMPPPEAKLGLSDTQRKLLNRWVEEGATWSEHWSFVPPIKPETPSTKDKTWPRSDLDKFVLARLEANGLQPLPRADPVTLIRRVTLDLTGVPPTPDEIDQFLNDDSPDAYENLVDRLMASPRYGQRMAWEWLDAARYADTDGFQADPTREMWPWRDWLIAALNDNMPFDQFTTEMLAGDLLPQATTEQIIATGFNRNHMYNGEGGRIPDETRVENVFDRTETTATIWLGLTMTCARCHDHKFDPITQEEYYRLFAFFNNTSESGAGGSGKAAPTINYLSPQQTREIEKLQEQIAEISRKMNAPNPELDAKQASWEAEFASRMKEFDFENNQISLGSWWVLGTFPPPDGDTVKSFAHNFGPETGVDLDKTFLDGKLRWRKSTELADGKIHSLPETIGATYLYRRLEARGERTVELSLGSDDTITVWLNGKQVLENNVNRGAAADQEQLTIDLQNGANELLLKIVNTGGAAGFYFRKKGESILGLPIKIAQNIASGKQDQATKSALREQFRSRNSPAWRDLRKQQSELNARRQEIEKEAARVMIMDSLPKDKRRDTYVLNRGTYNKPLDKKVTCGTPAFLPAIPDDIALDRLSLARWIVSEGNPLTARVTVNRYWQTFFGKGLVKTSEDFGRQGALPTHPLLLDWLGRQFIESGWNVKRLHKFIVMSATYRQSSRDPRGNQASSYVVDPENRLLSRGPRFRMPSWMLRDQALAISGLLVERIGGPPVNPYQPEGIWAEATFGKIKYQQGRGDDLYRRSLYTFWRRIVGPTVFFDVGKRQTCLVKPTRTNSPLHALTTLNETTFVESAKALAEKIMKIEFDLSTADANSSELTEKRIGAAFRMATARHAEPEVLSHLVRRWNQTHKVYKSNPDEAQKLLAVGQHKPDAELDSSELAAYTVVCSLILNLDEVLTKE